jgi:hypothetical protein
MVEVDDDLARCELVPKFVTQTAEFDYPRIGRAAQPRPEREPPPP